MIADDAVSVWLARLQAGDRVAVRPLWERYFQRLVGLARTRLRNSPRQAADEEDVALSAFDSFCRNAEHGRFPDLNDRAGLWRLLAAFTVRKASRQIRDAGRLKRGGTIVEEGSAALMDVFEQEPDPALAVEMAEECERLLAALGDDELRRLAILRMDGGTVEEVARTLGCAPRSVKRKLALIRSIWEREAADEPA